MPAPKTYDPGLYVLTLFGGIVAGYADGTFIELARDTDGFTKTIGADGEVSRTRSRNKGGSLKLTLKQTSSSNDVLSAKQALDESGGVGYGAMLLKDLGGSTVASCEQAWIKKLPTVGLGKEEGTREWEIDLGELNLFAGGN